MYKLLIVDDEPLVQVGIKSMLDWNALGLEICGTAINGQAALKIIEEQSPDIVITDIKMPVMDGLELTRVCRERYGSERPFFLILTSYEDFHMAKEALTYQVSDYLVKLELTPENLRSSVEKVLEKLRESERDKCDTDVSSQSFYDKFLIRLLYNLFESEDQFALQSRDLGLDFHYKTYVCCYGELQSSQAEALPAERQFALYTSSLRMVQELVMKYRFCYALALDTRHLALIFCYEEDCAQSAFPCVGEITDILCQVNVTLENYYNVGLRCGIGSPVENPVSISESYQCSRMAFQEAALHPPVIAFEQCARNDSSHHSFNFSLFKSGLTKAFEEYDPEALTATIGDICELFLANPQHYVQALDAACNILYLSISLLQNGEAVVSDFYRDSPDGYRSIYRQTSVEQIVAWLKAFSEKLAELFESRSRDYKNHIVANVKKYIHEHIREKLTLNEVATVFSISPNYLSQLFGRYNEIGFSEYISQCKINESKKLLEEGGMKIYEVADALGFESAFYFSKVFKKIEGVSPTDYVNNKLL